MLCQTTGIENIIVGFYWYEWHNHLKPLQLQNYLNFLTTFAILLDRCLLLHRKRPKSLLLFVYLSVCILYHDSTDSIKDLGKDAVTHRPYLHGHHVYLLSTGMLRLMGIAVRSSKNRHYLGPDHVGSNHARQIQGEHSLKKTRGQFINNRVALKPVKPL